MAAEAVCHVRIGGIDVELFEVEVLAEPGALVGVFGMGGVGNGGEKFGIAPSPPQSSGGQLRLPATQAGYRPASSAG